MAIWEGIILLVSLAALAKSASMVVENALKISRFFGISQLASGFILLSVSTSLPELSVSVLSSIAGEGAIAAGNVFGSNIANILLVLGIGAFLYGLRINRAEIKDVALILTLTTVVSIYIVFNSSVRGEALGLLEGVILMLLFGGYIIYTFSKKRVDADGNAPVGKKEALSAFLMFCASIVVVFVSSGFVVESAVVIATSLGIAESFIGATVIAIGTSLPELAVDLQAIRRRHYGLALGDAIGSNMTNLTLVLGAAAAINPISVMLPVFMAALLFAVIASVMLLYHVAVSKRLGRFEGSVFLLLYAFFVAAMFYLQLGELAT